MEDYSYDVFISYRRQRNKSEWLIEHFIPLFEEYLSDDIIDICGRVPQKIFFDQADLNPNLRQFERTLKGIEPGVQWRDALREAIRGSRCMVGVWSPGYFVSDWCCIEWNSFSKRQQATSKTTIIPISVHDGNSFPEAAKAIQTINMNDFMIVGEAFRKSEIYLDFQKALKQLSRQVAMIVKEAPAYLDWPIDDSATAKQQATIAITRL